MAAPISHATWCSLWTASASTTPPCAGVSSDGGTNSMVASDASLSASMRTSPPVPPQAASADPPVATRSRPASRTSRDAGAAPASATAAASSPGRSTPVPGSSGRPDGGAGRPGAAASRRPAVPYSVTPSAEERASALATRWPGSGWLTSQGLSAPAAPCTQRTSRSWNGATAWISTSATDTGQEVPTASQASRPSGATPPRG